MGSTVGSIFKWAAVAVGVAALVFSGLIVFAPEVAALVAGAAGLAATAAGAATLSSILALTATALSVGAGLLSPRPKTPGIGHGTLDRLNVSVDPNTPRKAVFGNTAMNTDMRDQEVENITGSTGTDDMNIHRWIVMAAHKVQSLDEIWFEDEQVWTLAGGVVSTKYQGYLTVSVVLEGTPANYIAYSGRTPAASRRFTGCAYVYFKFYLNPDSPFANSIPTRITLRGKGMPTYDPRKDSTVPGGSGTQRANDNTTWSYGVGGTLQGENTACQLLSWLLGWYIINPVTSARKLSVGKGIPQDRLDLPSFITAANICDEAVTLAAGGSEKRYRSAGIVTEGEEMTSVTDRLKASMAGDLDDVDGKIRLTIYVNDLGAPVASFTENDILSDFEWRPSNSLHADYNVITGRFVNPSDQSLYQLSEYPPVKLTSRDGIDRPQTLDFGMVQSQSQCERIAKQWLQRAQYPGTFKAAFQFSGHKAQKGDLVNLTFGPLGFNALPFRVVEKEYRGDGTVPMTLRIENGAIYAWANSDGPLVNYAQPIVYSRADTPWQRMITGDWQQPGTSAQDANLLKDATFSTTFWSRTSFLYCQRVRGSVTNSGQFPVDSVQNYVGEITLNHGVQNFSYKRNFPRVVAGRLYYITCGVAKGASGMSGTATVRGTLQYLNDANANVGSALNVDVTLANLPAGGVYQVQVASMVAPVGATKADVTWGVLTNTATGKVRLDNPKLLDKEPGADVTTALSGPTTDTITYGYTGVVDAGQLPKGYLYKLANSAGDVTSGVVWTYKVYAGGVNSFTSASGVKSMTGTGYGTFTLNTLDTATADVDIYAAYNGKTIGPFRLHLVKYIAPAPVSGGGSSGAASSQSTGFGSFNSTTFAAISSLQYTMPAGVTTAILSANISANPSGTTVGSWGCEGKWQKESAVGSGVWADVGTVVSSTSSIANVGTPTEPSYEKTPADLTKSVSATGLTGGTLYSFRYVGRIITGTQTHFNSGTTSVTS